MFKKIFNLLKKLMLSVLFLYAFNCMATSLNIFIPMNMLTILLVSVCGVPSIIMLVFYFKFFM